MVYIHPYIEVKQSPIHNRGVFTNGDLKYGEVIERCHYTVLETKYKDLDITMKRYVFSYPKNGENCSVVWGFGSIYNHSLQPNIEYHYEGDVMVFKTIKNINKGEELLHNYKDSHYKK